MLSTIFVTTPCLNARDTIDRTILSVATQAGEFRIRYHVQDGGSTDGTRERLDWWRRRLGSRAFPIQCAGLEFSVSSEPDHGMYDAICRGFAAMLAGGDDFVTWLNADDILMPGALAFVASASRQFSAQQVSWLGGSACILRDDMVIASYDRPVPNRALGAGLCDGTHWTFLQQEGTFFRNWLWTSVDPDRTIRPMKLAGDWNLWRLFAQKASLVQCKFPLGGFRISADQLSARQRDRYAAEIDALVPAEHRRAALAELGRSGEVTRRVFSVAYQTGALAVKEERRNRQYSHHYREVFGEDATISHEDVPARTIHEGTLVQSDADADAVISFRDNILAFDRDWQFPAISEQHAYHRVREIGGVPDGVTYVAYPWATLIDKIQTKAPDAYLYLREFRDFCRRLPAGTVKVTVCQHILLRRFMSLFEEAGISELFWTHATRADIAAHGRGTINLHAFPLYPVQVPEGHANEGARPHLFSFIGAKSNKYYLTRAREWILELLAADPRGLVIGRDSWHYNRVVYDHQIRKRANGGDTALVDQSASDQFKASLQQSVFSLCPSGSGPNSIRLWESIGAGAIPVILADTYAPPGNPKLWEAAAVFCEETPEAIAALPNRLERIAADPERLAMMRRTMRQLWMLYGPQSFIYDVQHLMLERVDGTGAASSAPGTEKHSLLDRLTEELQQRARLSQEDALLLLTATGGELLLGNTAGTDPVSESTPLGQLVVLARETLPESHPSIDHFDRVLAHVETQAQHRVAAPRIARRHGPRICLYGRHSNRTPLAYGPFRRLAGDRVTLVEEPHRADIVMTGFNLDLRENAETFRDLAANAPDTRVVVLSEEPLWDSIWSGGFTERARVAELGDVTLPYTFLNHQNSRLFEFDRIPYFLLTNEDYLTRYGCWISWHGETSPEALLEHWKRAPVSAAFVAEVRDDERYAAAYPVEDVYGLSTYRTEVARRVGGAVLREGKGWKEQARRQDLPDWHLDKLTALDRRVRVASAYENTHQRAYISEKIFDAFVVGGIPTYHASPEHRIFDLVPASSMINTYGQSAEDAARAIEDFTPDIEFARIWLQTARDLQARFTDIAAVTAERRRVVDGILKEIEALF